MREDRYQGRAQMATMCTSFPLKGFANQLEVTRVKKSTLPAAAQTSDDRPEKKRRRGVHTTGTAMEYCDLNFRKGSASCKCCNCLIHTILQCIIDNDIQCKATISSIRARLRERYPDVDNRVTVSNNMDVRYYWRAVVYLHVLSAREHGYDQVV